MRHLQPQRRDRQLAEQISEGLQAERGATDDCGERRLRWTEDNPAAETVRHDERLRLDLACEAIGGKAQ
jgi:hypothetical protein